MGIMGLRGLRLAGVSVGYAAGYAVDKFYVLKKENKENKENKEIKEKKENTEENKGKRMQRKKKETKETKQKKKQKKKKMRKGQETWRKVPDKWDPPPPPSESDEDFKGETIGYSDEEDPNDKRKPYIERLF